MPLRRGARLVLGARLLLGTRLLLGARFLLGALVVLGGTLVLAGLDPAPSAAAPTPSVAATAAPTSVPPSEPDGRPSSSTTSATATPPSTPTGPTSPTNPTSTAAPTTVRPTTPTPTPTASPTTVSPTPTATPTVAPARRPANPAVARLDGVPIWSIAIALAVLLASIPVLVRLSRTAENPAEATTTIRPATDGTDTLVLMTAAGEAMIDSGYDVTTVQAALDDIAFANGLSQAESIALPTAVFVSARIGGQVRTGAVATGHQIMRLHQIEELEETITGARRGRLTPSEALEDIARIRSLPPPYPPGLQLLGQILSSAALAVLLGASGIGVVVSAVLGALVGAVQLAGRQIPARFQVLLTVASAFVVGLAVFLLSRTPLDIGVLPSLVAPLILLLPGALLTTSVIELATGQMISGAGRLVAGGMQLVLLALGIVAAAALVGVPAIDLSAAYTPLGPVGPWLAVAVFGVGVVLNRAARLRSLTWILLVLYVAYGAQVIGSQFFGGVLSAFVGAAAMTPVAALVARQRTGPPAMVSFSPAFWLLVPGALGLVGVTTILDGDTNGVQTVLTTIATMVAIALGVLVGWALTGMVRRMRRHLL